jgi:hypothetical protein
MADAAKLDTASAVILSQSITGLGEACHRRETMALLRDQISLSAN